MNRRVIARLVLLFLLPLWGYAQDENEVLGKIFQTLSQVDSLMNNPEPYSFVLSDTLLEYDLENEKEKIEVWVKELKNVNSARNGVNLSMSYDYRFGPKIIDEGDDAYLGYTNRIQSTLSWNITQSGLVGKGVNDRRSDLLGEKKYLGYKESAVREAIGLYALEREDLVNSYFNRILDSQIQLTQSLMTLQKYLQKEERVLPVEVIDLKYRLSLLQGEYRPSSRKRELFLDASTYISKQKTIDLSSLDSILQASTFSQKKIIDQQLLTTEAESVSYIKGVGITPYVRGQYYDQTYATRGKPQVVGNIGVSISLPLTNEARIQKKEIKNRSLLLETESEVELKQLRKNIESLIRDLNNNLNLLIAADQAKQHYKDRVMEYRRLYASQKTPIQTLLKEYDKLLGCHLTICNLIGQREQLTMRLISARQGVLY